MSKRIFYLLLSLLFFGLLPSQVVAIYDPLSVPNNRFGIHLLEPAEVDKASQLVNSSGGDWGYVTIPIRANDRDLAKWTKFMQDCKEKHIIPIVRLLTFSSGDHWMAPNEFDLIDFANFLGQLPWPIHNRYIIVYNEPNHVGEWGGFIYPEEYASVLDRAIDIFHKKNQDFFIISAGFDSSAPNGPSSMNEYDYLRIMNNHSPGIFNRVDGFSSHSYGNPGFFSFANLWSAVSVANYHFEENFLSSLGTNRPKIFITEAGWRNDLIGDVAAKNFYTNAFQNIWIDDNVVAITPFVFEAHEGPFLGFSFVDGNGNLKPFARNIQELPKTAGQPQLAEMKIASSTASISTGSAPSDNSSYIIRLWNGLMHLISK